MIVRINQDRFGNLEIDPVNQRTERRARRHLREAGVKVSARDSLIYLQGDAADTFLDSDIAPGAARSVREGYRTDARISPELFAALIGYDYT